MPLAHVLAHLAASSCNHPPTPSPHLTPCSEYYEKGGEMLPGQKGISLPEEQWARLLSGLPGLAAAADAAA